VSVNEKKRSWAVLPLPAFVLHPYTALIVAAVHVYLASGHLMELFGGNVKWTHIWKGFGALAGVYVFAALASRGFARHAGPLQKEPLIRSHV
jgi:hypothetical protein